MADSSKILADEDSPCSPKRALPICAGDKIAAVDDSFFDNSDIKF